VKALCKKGHYKDSQEGTRDRLWRNKLQQTRILKTGWPQLHSGRGGGERGYGKKGTHKHVVGIGGKIWKCTLAKKAKNLDKAEENTNTGEGDYANVKGGNTKEGGREGTPWSRVEGGEGRLGGWLTRKSEKNGRVATGRKEEKGEEGGGIEGGGEGGKGRGRGMEG